MADYKTVVSSEPQLLFQAFTVLFFFITVNIHISNNALAPLFENKNEYPLTDVHKRNRFLSRIFLRMLEFNFINSPIGSSFADSNSI
jgi:hypothetical protein